MLGNTFVVQKDMQPPTKEVPPQVDMPSLNSVVFIINLDTVNLLFTFFLYNLTIFWLTRV